MFLKTNSQLLLTISMIIFSFVSCSNGDKGESPHFTESDIESAIMEDMDDEARDRMKSGEESYTYWNSLENELKNAFIADYTSADDKREVFENYYRKIGPDAYLDYVEMENPYCHSQAHDIGKTVFANTLDFNKALNICGNRCTNGCMHGVVAESMGKEEYRDIMVSVNSLCGTIPGDFDNENFDKAGTAMNEFCSTGEISSMHKKGNCAHAMGHALMMISDNDLGKSLKGCRGFPEEGMGYYCATGVYMEHALNFYNKMMKNKKSFKMPSDHYPCDKYSEYPAACYRYHFPFIAFSNKVSPDNAVSVCLELEGARRKGCFHGLGTALTRFAKSNPSLIKNACSKGDESEQVMCIEGTIEKLADMNEEDALNLCRNMKGILNDACLKAANEKMYRLDKESMDLYCQ